MACAHSDLLHATARASAVWPCIFISESVVYFAFGKYLSLRISLFSDWGKLRRHTHIPRLPPDFSTHTLKNQKSFSHLGKKSDEKSMSQFPSKTCGFFRGKVCLSLPKIQKLSKNLSRGFSTKVTLQKSCSKHRSLSKPSDPQRPPSLRQTQSF